MALTKYINNISSLLKGVKISDMNKLFCTTTYLNIYNILYIINMDCIFCCVFNQEKYVEMFFILLESIFIYGNLDENTEILVYTSTKFMNKIIQSHLFNEKIKFEINDTYDNVDKSCKARLDLFNLDSIKRYNKVLYLDTDIIVKDDMNKIFNVCKEDIL